jgi:predicted aconitase with swiveling domain
LVSVLKYRERRWSPTITFPRATISTASRASHKLAGQSYVDKIMVFNTAKGGVASAWMLHEMKSRGVAPQAILFNNVNPILAQGAALADMALCDRFDDGDVTQLIRTGDRVTVNPGAGLVIVTRG